MRRQYFGPKETEENNKVKKMMLIIHRYPDVICHDIDTCIDAPLECFKDYKGMFRIGYKPTLRYIMLPRTKLVVSYRWVDLFVQAAKNIKRATYSGYTFFE